MEHDLVVVGAGIAGLSLARRLTDEGVAVRLLERSRGLGGRCATRRIEGRPVDHGVPFLHGRSAAFAAALTAVEGCTPLRDWPFHVRGSGIPCQPQAYRAPAVRLAMLEGVSCFAKHLARDLTVEREVEVRRLSLEGSRLLLETSAGARTAHAVVLACAVDEMRPLLQSLAGEARGDARAELDALIQMLRGVHTVPCLTVIAGYAAAPPLDLDLLLPDVASPIHSLIVDSAKRPRVAGEPTVLVLQGQPGFSRELLDAPAERWRDALLTAAAALVGDWAARPSWTETHIWRSARVERGDELAHPALLRWRSGATLGLCGDALHPAGGVEGAFLSGLELAVRLRSKAATVVDGNGEV